MHQRLILAAFTLTAFFGVSSAALAQTNFNVYVALGDSLTAGVVSNSLVTTRQRNSVPAHIARQAGATDFQQPLISEPGIPAELMLVSLTPALVIAPKSATPGAPANLGLGRSYNNLGVPGATLIDLLTRTTDMGGLHDIILRGRGTALAQGTGLRPTFVTLWIGNNDVLGAAVRGRAIDGVTLTPAATFRAAYEQVIIALRATGAGIVATNLPDVTTIPFVNTISRVVLNPSTGQPVLVNGQPVPLLGPTGPLPPGSFVTLAASTLIAQGQGVPTAFGGRGTPLPDEVILDPAEVATIKDRVNANNQAIRDICGAANIPVLDVNRLLADLVTTGRNVGGVRLSGGFLTGGFFSYDGVHPSELGYAVIANEFIRLINSRGGKLPEVNLAPFLGVGVARSTAYRPPPPFEFTLEAYEQLLQIFPTLSGR